MTRQVAKDAERIATRLRALGYRTERRAAGIVHAGWGDGWFSVSAETRKAELGTTWRVVKSFVAPGDFTGRGWQERLANACHEHIERFRAEWKRENPCNP